MNKRIFINLILKFRQLLPIYNQMKVIDKQEYQKLGKVAQTIKVDSHFHIKNILLGKGSFGTVCACWDSLTKQVCAAKEINKHRLLEFICRSKYQKQAQLFIINSLRHEASILKKINHPNVISLFDQTQNQISINFYLEYCNQGSLNDLIRSENILDHSVAVPLIKKIAKACHYLHKNHIIHRDLKLSNIFLNNGQPKIGDFGFAIQLDDDLPVENFSQIFPETKNYMAPEVLLKLAITTQSDVWSLGVIFYFLICGSYPFNPNQTKTWQTQLKGPIKFPQELNIPQFIKKIIENMLQYNYKKRIDMGLVLDFLNY